MNRRALAIAAAAAVLVLLLWYLLLWSPRKHDLSEAKAREAAAQQKEQELQVQLQRLQAAQKEEPLRRAQLERLQTAIPEGPNLAQLILDVNDAAIRSGVTFASIAPTPPAAGAAGGPPEIRLTFAISGGYFQVLDFINRLDALPRLIVIDTVNLSPDATGAQIAASIAGRAFLRQVAPTGASAPTTAPPAAPPPAGVTSTTVAAA